MDIRSLEELRQADEQTLRFTSLGLATGGKLRPEDAAVFQQEVISHAELVPAVAEGTRNTFERLRSLHAYGVLFYDIFTAVEDLTHLVIEQALRDRFLEFHDGVVPFEDARGTVREVTAATFDVLYDEIHKEGRLRRPQRWRLRLRRTGRTVGRGHPARGRCGRSGVHRAPYDRRPAGVLRGRCRSAPARLLAALTIPGP